MKEKIKVAIVGYGNLGKGVESQLSKNPDMELVCIFTRRNPSKLNVKSKVNGFEPFQNLRFIQGC